MKQTKEKHFKILIVDDNSKNIQVIGNVLRNEKYEVGFAFNGQQALTLLQENNNYDLVLLDVNMPVLNGFETCKILRKDEKFKDIPIIFLTALNDSADIITGFDVGGQDYITKPFNLKELLSRVKTHLELKQSKDELAYANLNLERRVVKRTNQLNKAKQKAEESDRLKTIFLELMSHEIRTPLNSIVGFSNIIAEENKNDKLLKFSNIIYNQTDLLMKLVNDILDCAQIESGSINFLNESINLNKLLNELSNELEKNCSSDVSLISNTPIEEIYIIADKIRFKQIFINLILNAIKFTPKGTITFGYDIEGDNEIIYFVKDTGIGIPAKNHHDIFERFNKLDSFTQGIGLGLCIVKNLVNQWGGKVWIESELKKGATFYFKIPVKIIKTPSTKNKLVNKNSNVINNTNNVLTILIAEDEISNFMFLSEILEGNNIKIIHANNGKEAIEYCKNNKEINIVLMDINMPILNGYEATKQIKKAHPELPVIAQTAYVLSEDKMKAKEIGFDGFLSKPINKKKLFEYIEYFT